MSLSLVNMSLSDTLFKGTVSVLGATTLVSGIWFSAIAVDTVRQDAKVRELPSSAHTLMWAKQLTHKRACMQRKKSELSGPEEELTQEKK